MMQRLSQAMIVTLTAVLALSACHGITVSQPDYDRLPGSGDHMAEGPGLFTQDSANAGKDGYLIYSSDADKHSLLNQGQTATRQPASPQSGNAVNAPAGSSEEQEYRQFQAFQRYQAYQDFKHAQNDPKSQQEFERWQQWQRERQNP